MYGFSNNMKIKNLNKDVNIIDSLKTTPRMNEKYKESELEKDGFITNKLNNNLINEDDIIVENETTEIYKETHKNECSYDRKSELDNKKKKFSNNFFKDNDDMKHKINNNEKFLGKNSEQSVIEENKKRMPSNNYTGYDNLFIKKNSENKSIESTSDNTINPNESKHDKSNQKLFYNIIHDSSKTEDKKIKLEEINISKVLKRVVENNKKEASVRQRELYSCYPKSYLNLNHNSEKTQSHFFIGANENRRPSTDIPHKPFLNSIEYSFQNILLWKKHEEIWLNVSSYGYLLSPELEKYLLPPNEYDVLLSSYCKLNNKFLDKIVINDPIQNPNEELNKWKNAYKKTVMRWHPDKLHPLIDMLKLKDESRKNILKKKSGHIMNNMYKMMQSILEILKKIIKRKE